MKHLIILRHGEAVPEGSDFSRSLTSRGTAGAKKAAEAILKVLQERQIPLPALLMSSTAARARQTAEIAGEILLAAGGELRLEPSLYLPSRENCLELIWGAGGAETLLLCSHNPGMTDLANSLFGWRGILSPAEYVIGRLDIPAWPDLLPGRGDLIRI